MKLIDSHCHMDFRQFDKDREEVIEECMEKLELIVNCGSSPETNINSLELSENYPGFVYPCMGIHPIRINEMSKDDLEEVIREIRNHSDEIIAIGEIGLDYNHEKEQEGRRKQERFLEPLLDLAEELEKPVVLHSRDAEKRVLEILEGYDLESVILHCFNGSVDLAEEAVDRGYYISVSTQVLYSTRVQNIVEEIPVDRILLETDSPFLYPGDERNVPYNVHESLEKISEIRGMQEEELGDIFNRNTRKAYLHQF